MISLVCLFLLVIAALSRDTTSDSQRWTTRDRRRLIRSRLIIPTPNRRRS